MSENDQIEPQTVVADTVVAETESKPSRTLSVVWLVPLVAMIIALWLAYQAWKDSGPVIEIVLDKAEGIAVGKTLIKYRDVEVGEIIDIGLSENLDKVRVRAEMDPEIKSVISESSRFWVVSPRISLSGVSGLNTLLSGVYIEMDPGASGRYQDSFEGLSEPPAFRSYDEGTSYKLISESLGSIDIGSPIYHRQIPVGEVTSYRLSTVSARVEISAFIKAPYDQMVRQHTNFWNVSGFGLEFTADGVEAKMESFFSVLAGGIAFARGDTSDGDAAAEEGARFNLFPSRKALLDGAYTISYPYALRFTENVRGLRLGAPVEFRGLKVGEVTDLELSYVVETGQHEVMAYISIQPGRLAPDIKPEREDLDELLDRMIQEGMRAQLKTGSYLSGALYVDLVPEAEPDSLAELIWDFRYSEIPTQNNQYVQLIRQVTAIIDKVQAMPFESIGNNLDQSLAQVRDLVQGVNNSYASGSLGVIVANLEEASHGLDDLVQQLEETAASLDHSIAPDSRLQHELSQMMEEITEAAEAFEALMEELNRYPNSLITGKEGSE